MFIISTKDGKNLTEGEEYINSKTKQSKRLSWDEVPTDIRIVALQLLYPFPIKFRKPGSDELKETNPKLSIKGFHKYYFMNEATIPLLVTGGKVVSEGKSNLEAKIIAGVDESAKIVIEFRLDKWGNCSVNKYPLKRLEDSIKQGLFRSEILRKGI